MYDSSNTVNRWLIYSGGLRHITPNELEFTVYVNFQKPQNVSKADGRVVDAIGTFNNQSNSNIRCRQKVTLYNMLHVPALKENLFFV